MTSLVAPLFNNASTVIPSCVFILSSPIFTVTSLNDLPSIFLTSFLVFSCYELKPLERGNRTTLVLSNTRELDRVPSTE